MPQQRRGLGRGLGALIPTAASVGGNGGPGIAAGQRQPDVAGAYFDEVPVEAIVPNPRQPRQAFDQDTLDELANSIEAVGLLQPVVVRKADDHYEIVMGERRWRACQRAGLTAIRAIVRSTSDDDLLRNAL